MKIESRKRNGNFQIFEIKREISLSTLDFSLESKTLVNACQLDSVGRIVKTNSAPKFSPCGRFWNRTQERNLLRRLKKTTIFDKTTSSSFQVYLNQICQIHVNLTHFKCKIHLPHFFISAICFNFLSSKTWGSFWRCS